MEPGIVEVAELSPEQRAAHGDALEATIVRASSAVLWRSLVDRQMGVVDYGASYRAAAEAALVRISGFVQRWS